MPGSTSSSDQLAAAKIDAVKALAWRMSMDLRQRMADHVPAGGLFVTVTPDDTSSLEVLRELIDVWEELAAQADELIDQLTDVDNA